MIFGPFTSVDNHKKCVTFAAGLLSKEDIDHYVWLFSAFLEAMRREQVGVITDQCPSMLQAIPIVFLTAKHRLCMWHILKKFSMLVSLSFMVNIDLRS